MDKSISTLSAHNSPYPFRRMWTLSIAACIICTIVLLYSPLSPVGDLRLHERFQGIAGLGYSGQWRVDEREVWRKRHKLCAVKDVVEGEWVVKKRLGSKDELFERYGFNKNGSIRQFCEPTKVAPTKLPNGQKSWPKEALLERLLDVASPEFVPRPNLARARGEESYWSSECNVAPLEQREFIKRMLRSRAGLVLVGDSLTQQHVGQLENFLSMTPYIQRQGFKDVITRLEYRLDLQTATYAAEVDSIIQEAGVTRERAAKPFMTYLRHHHLTMPEESDMIFKDISPAYELTKQPIGMDWFARLTGMVDEEPFIAEENVREEPSVVILNTGPHWTGGEFGKMNQSDFRIAYGRMVELVDKKVRNAPFPISTYWRSVLPGQADCKPMDKFDNARTDTLSPEDPEKGVFNYLWFPWMNEWMAQGRSSERPTKQFRDWFRQYRATGIAPINPPSLYLDAYPMSVKRPEAHHSPPVDCLHFCDIGVPDQWTALMWHMIVLESLNTDYI